VPLCEISPGALSMEMDHLRVVRTSDAIDRRKFFVVDVNLGAEESVEQQAEVGVFGGSSSRHC
jgi:hypothetical protein